MSSVKNKKLLYGIVVASGLKDEFPNKIYHPLLREVEDNFMAIERSILECAYAGCDSIWVVCDELFSPVLKERIGKYVLDPVNRDKANFSRCPSSNQKFIPIYYYYIHARDRDKRNSIGWGALHGCRTAFYISKKISSWATPDKYYISFPYGIYDYKKIRKHRLEIRAKENILFCSDEDESAADGNYLAFTLNGEDVRESIYATRTRGPALSNFSGLCFSEIFKEVFDNSKKKQIGEYFSCFSWQNWVLYIRDKNISFDKEDLKLLKK